MKPTPSLDAHWMPFTANRQFKQNPHLISRAEGAYLYDQQGRRLFDSLSGLWCCGLGHTRTEITQAVTEQMGRLDYSPAFQVGHELSFELANRLVEKTPAGLNKVFFTCSGSEAADTALKMARAYWRMMGQATKTRFIGRGKGYHGVNFGGLSVGGIGANRKLYGNMLEADHLNHTWLPENAFSRGLPAYGAHLANELEEIIALNDASNIAAVIVEPFAGSGGVIVPPQGYLQRLRELCNQYNILLIFDEVITGFYRTGQCFGAQTFGVTPDIINVAKGLTNAAIPQGAVIAHEKIYKAFMEANLPLHAIEFPHGYTYSAHPVACAAGIAAMQLYDSEHIEAKVNDLIPYFENALHQLKGLPHLEDLRNCGLAGAIQLAARQGDGTIRPRELFESCWQQGLYLRYGGNNISLAPPFISEKSEIDQMFNILADEIRKLK